MSCTYFAGKLARFQMRCLINRCHTRSTREMGFCASSLLVKSSGFSDVLVKKPLRFFNLCSNKVSPQALLKTINVLATRLTGPWRSPRFSRRKEEGNIITSSPQVKEYHSRYRLRHIKVTRLMQLPEKGLYRRNRKSNHKKTYT